MHNDPEYAIEALEAGALGYVLKHSATSELLTAVREALDDRVYLTPMIANDVLDRLASGKKQGKKAELSLRQRDLLHLLVKGLSAKEIASQMGISRKTVEYHKYKTMKQIGVETTAELIEYAVKEGIVGE